LKKGYIDRVGPGPSAGTPPHDFRGGSVLSLSSSVLPFFPPTSSLPSLSLSLSLYPIYYRHRVHIAFSHAPSARFSYPTRPRHRCRSKAPCVDAPVPLPRGLTRSPVSPRCTQFGVRGLPFRHASLVRGVSSFVDDTSVRGLSYVVPNVSSLRNSYLAVSDFSLVLDS